MRNTGVVFCQVWVGFPPTTYHPGPGPNTNVMIKLVDGHQHQQGMRPEHEPALCCSPARMHQMILIRFVVGVRRRPDRVAELEIVSSSSCGNVFFSPVLPFLALLRYIFSAGANSHRDNRSFRDVYVWARSLHRMGHLACVVHLQRAHLHIHLQKDQGVLARKPVRCAPREQQNPSSCGVDRLAPSISRWATEYAY